MTFCRFPPDSVPATTSGLDTLMSKSSMILLACRPMALWSRRHPFLIGLLRWNPMARLAATDAVTAEPTPRRSSGM
jgi:hypothetical protein